MKILVCIKQVPEMERITVGDGAMGMAALDFPNEWRMNRFDEFAVEAAVRIREAGADVRIDGITVGPSRAADVLKRPMGMGVDEGVHIQTPGDADPGPEAVTRWIARYAGPRGYGLILCGAMSEDRMNGQVGPMLAACMDLPYATQVMAIQPDPGLSELAIEREIEAGVREMLTLRLPALLALQPGIHIPRYPSLSRLLRAQRQPIQTLSAEALGPVETLTDPVGLRAPQRRRASQILTGSARDKADRLAAILREKALI